MEFLGEANTVLWDLHRLALSLLETQSELLLGVEEDIKKLSISLITIQSVVYEKKQLDEPVFSDWLARVVAAARDAEKVLKSLETEACLWKQKQQASNAPLCKIHELEELKDVLARLYAVSLERKSRKERRCEFLGCTKGKTAFCIAHGGGRRCCHQGCSKAARGKRRLCIGHGGGKRCTYGGCSKSAEGLSGLCISHGGGRRCQYPECRKMVRWYTMLCKAHVGMGRASFGNKSASGLTDYSGDKRCWKPEFSKCEVVGVEDMDVNLGEKQYCLSVGSEAELSSLTSCVTDGRVQEDGHGSGIDRSKIMNVTDSRIKPFLHPRLIVFFFFTISFLVLSHRWLRWFGTYVLFSDTFSFILIIVVDYVGKWKRYEN